MIIQDAEFGEVIVRKNPLSRAVRFSVSPSGRLQMSVPQHTSDFLVKRFLNSNRTLIREKIPSATPKPSVRATPEKTSHEKSEGLLALPP